MYWYTRIVAKGINSDALMADAWHHRSDALSSVGSLIGIGGAMLGFPILDSLACVIICVFILKVAMDIFMGAVNKMIDRACDPEITDQIKEIILSNEDIISLDLLKTRIFASKIFVDVEISINGEVTLEYAHSVADEIHDKIEDQIPMVKHCMVHVNPK